MKLEKNKTFDEQFGRRTMAMQMTDNSFSIEISSLPYKFRVLLNLGI